MILSSEGPIFVRGMSRSGGTLLVTMLDSHPSVAMSYELYPNLLDPGLDGIPTLADLTKRLEGSATLRDFARSIDQVGPRTFFLRCSRSGLDAQALAQLLTEHSDAGMAFVTADERLRFVERCCRHKMKAEGKERWGLKCTSAFGDYLALWPNAYFVNMIRDGRDVLASQLAIGTFRNSPAGVGRGWSNTHLRFRELVRDPDVAAMEMFYERLVEDPEAEARKLCDFLDLEFSAMMLEFHSQQLTIFSAQHLSGARVASPIDALSVGRWEKELSASALSDFYSTARDAMAIFGYLEN